VGKGVIYAGVFKRGDTRTIYNVVYRDGKHGTTYAKRFAVTGITRDKEYNLTRGTDGSKVLYFSANPNGEAEILKVTLKPRARIRNLIFDYDMGELIIKGRSAMGNIVSKNEVHKIVLKQKGASTLGGLKIWFEPETLRLNDDGRGKYLGEFKGEDQILVVTKDGQFYQTGFDLNTHFEDNILEIEKYNPDTVWSAVYFDAEQNYFYIKRFQIESTRQMQRFIGEHPGSYLVRMTKVDYPRLEIKFGGDDQKRDPEIVEVSDFIGVKSYKAKGRRLTTYQVELINELEPLIVPEKDNDEADDSDDIEDGDDATPDGQMSIFDN
jgi:topoisomerase-4 subunit A